MPKLERTTIEDLRRARTPCPRKGCDGYVAEIAVPGYYEYKECNDCGHRYDLRNSKGKSVSQEEWEQLREKSKGLLAGSPQKGEAEERRAQARRREQYRQEMSEMTKSKKAVKDAGQKSAKKTAKSAGPEKPSMASIIRGVFEKSPAATDEQVVQAVKKQHPDAKTGASRVQRWRKRLGIKDQVKKPAKVKKTAKKVKKS